MVVPSREGAPYSWRVVWPDGSPATDFYGGGWGSGNPVDDGVEIGTQIEVLRQAQDGSWGLVHVRNTRINP